MLAACAAVVVSGCANMSGLDGTSEYACKAPQGVQCDSISGNYYNAIQDNLPSQRQERTNGVSEKLDGIRRATPAARDAVSLIKTQDGLDRSSPSVLPLPLRSQGRVLRLWFKPWEDADHDLYDQGYVYVQIDNGRWLIEHAQRRIRDTYAPIRAPRTAPASAQGAVTAARPTDAVTASRPSENAPSPSRAVTGAPDLPSIDIQ
jgi:conjugal transfer pilus assembly protein TraV